MKKSRIVNLTAGFLLVFSLTAGQTLARDDYDDSQSHPLRVLAYMAHPIGVVFETLIFRPFHAVVSATPETEYIFGHRPHPPLFAEPDPFNDFGAPRKVPAREKPVPPVRTSAREPTAENVTVKEVVVEKEIAREVPKIVEVEHVVFPEIAFRFNSSELTDLGRGQVYLAAERLKEKADIVVVIEGHADMVGSDDYNLRLGARRAETVKRELERSGVDTARMSIVSMGESKPLIDQQTGWARAVNRRVEFKVTGR